MNSTVSDLAQFLIGHMNDGIYTGTQILKKETVTLTCTAQPNNNWYGLAWMLESIKGISATGHSGDYPGVYTEMLFNQTRDIGVILFANGNPGYSLLPNGGYYIVGIDPLFNVYKIKNR